MCARFYVFRTCPAPSRTTPTSYPTARNTRSDSCCWHAHACSCRPRVSPLCVCPTRRAALSFDPCLAFSSLFLSRSLLQLHLNHPRDRPRSALVPLTCTAIRATLDHIVSCGVPTTLATAIATTMVPVPCHPLAPSSYHPWATLVPLCFTRGSQVLLHRLLLAYSNHNQVVGYCQGMNYVAGMLLLVMAGNEE